VVVGSGDIDSDGVDEILTMPGPDPNAIANVRAWNVDGGEPFLLESQSFDAFDSWMTHGGRIAGIEMTAATRQPAEHGYNR